jgi:hypothetical protein
MNDEIEQSFKLPARWSIRVSTRSGNSADLKVAIGFDHTLEIFETTTPFKFDFEARQFTALMTLTDSTEEIVAEEWSDVFGEFRKTGSGGGGSTQKFMFCPHGPLYGLSGSAF